MADPYASEVSPEDIINGASTESLRLERQADAILTEGPRPSPLHVAVREDAAEARAWADRRVKKRETPFGTSRCGPASTRWASA